MSNQGPRRGKPRGGTDLPHCGFSGLLAFLAHLETLLGVETP